MKARILSIVFTFSLFGILTVGTASAQIDGLIKVHIPFEFIVAGQTLPAGDYTVERGMTTDPGVVLIRNTDGENSVYVGVDSAYTRKTPSDTYLSFDEIGNKYFLRDIWRTGDDTGREIPKSKEERRLERGESQLSQTIKIHLDVTGKVSQATE